MPKKPLNITDLPLQYNPYDGMPKPRPEYFGSFLNKNKDAQSDIPLDIDKEEKVAENEYPDSRYLNGLRNIRNH
jgi:hypothetical protein